jgi:hypothetical protein
MNEITLQSRVAELLLQWPDLRPVLAEAGLGGLRDPDHWPSPTITIELAAQRHRVDAQSLLAAVTKAVAGRAPTHSLTQVDIERISQHQHDCHCGES